MASTWILIWGSASGRIQTKPGPSSYLLDDGLIRELDQPVTLLCPYCCYHSWNVLGTGSKWGVRRLRNTPPKCPRNSRLCPQAFPCVFILLLSLAQSRWEDAFCCISQPILGRSAWWSLLYQERNFPSLLISEAASSPSLILNDSLMELVKKSIMSLWFNLQ